MGTAIARQFLAAVESTIEVAVTAKVVQTDPAGRLAEAAGIESASAALIARRRRRSIVTIGTGDRVLDRMEPARNASHGDPLEVVEIRTRHNSPAVVENLVAVEGKAVTVVTLQLPRVLKTGHRVERAEVETLERVAALEGEEDGPTREGRADGSEEQKMEQGIR